MRHGLPDDVTAADDDGAGAVDLDLVLPQHLHHADRCGTDQRGLPEKELPRVERMQPVDVLGRGDCPQDPRFVDVSRERQLDEDRVDRVVRVQGRDPGEQFFLARLCGEPHVVCVEAAFERGLVLEPDVHL